MRLTTFFFLLALPFYWGCQDTQQPQPDAGADLEYDLFDGSWNPPGGQLVAQPDPLVFEVERLGYEVYRSLTLSNIGEHGLVVFDLEAVAPVGQLLEVLDADLPFGLHPGETTQVDLVFHPISCAPVQAALRIASSDEVESVKQVSLLTTGLHAEMSVDPESIAFGRVGANQRVSRSLRIENLGLCPLHIDRLQIEGSDHFSLRVPDPVTGILRPFSPDDLPFVVVAEEPLELDVVYYTPQDIPETAVLTIDAREEPEPWEIPLSANIRVPPVAVAQAWVLGRDDPPAREILTIPLETIQLDGSRSYDPDREVVAYRWLVLERPQDSTAALEPNELAVDPIFFLDLAGDYLFTLTVYDDDGLASTNTAEIRVTAVPDQDIHVQLVWNTPDDPDQYDRHGTDVDLHLLRIPGSWDTPPWDCHWKNMEPDWGQANNPEDDPSLDIDDVDGLGPENINLDRPESGVTYAIGVYYYSDREMGASFVTVRVYIDGVQRFEIADRELTRTGVFWDVGRITWPSIRVDTVDEIHPFGFPTSP
ncbi:MAG: hypothetical protein JW797_15865 [Bradymonadales bacterium]|nr:hypothetical protein [Bradymonadales bacterium]